MRRVVVTDLDDTLLDGAYSFEAAAPALAELRARGIPLILNTSKTAAETRVLVERLGLREPFAVENGGALYLPLGYFPGTVPGALRRDDDLMIPLGPALAEGLPGTVGFRDMSDDQVARVTGLPLEDAARARRREFDEAFTCPPELEPRLPALAAERGLRVSRGGRFWHLHGDSDKGRALRHLRDLYVWRDVDVRLIALGDGPNDLPMLLEADVAIAVPRPDGRVHPALLAGVPRLRVAPAPGPAGWNEAVLAIIRE